MKEKFTYSPSYIFDNGFGRTGEITRLATEVHSISDYPISILETERLSKPDEIVRQVESDFSAVYDEVQFVSPGMRSMAEADSVLLEEWIGDVKGKRVLDIGPGTGRITLPLADAVGNTGKVYAVETAKPYLEKLRVKAAKAGVNTAQLKLGVADIQKLSAEQLLEFCDNKPVDIVTMWFGPLALMTTKPQEVLGKIQEILKPGGVFLMTTNSLNGLPYRLPESAIRDGADPELPLGYKPSIFTRRSFPDAELGTPTGMILGKNLVLPARFYDAQTLQDMTRRAGLKPTSMRGISRLTGLFPQDPSNQEAMDLYAEIATKIYPAAGARIQRAKRNPEVAFTIARACDQGFANDPSKLDDYNYLALKAVKT